MYYIISFLEGMSIMILELTGIEALNNFFDKSNLVYTSIIGVIMVSLSIGYYLGGIISGYKPSRRKLSLLFALSAIYILAIAISKFTFIKFFLLIPIDYKFQILLFTLTLFLFPSLLLGATTPYIIQIALNIERNIEKTGLIAGKFYSISTIGSIIGTFLCGFWLIEKYSIYTIFYALVITIFICAILPIFSTIKRKG